MTTKDKALKQALLALERAKKWIGTITPPSVISFLEEDSRRWWQSGNAVFMRNWPYVYTLANADSSPVKGKFDVAPLPGATPGTSAATLGGWQLAVSKYSKHPEIAADIVLFMTSAEIQKMRAIKGSYNPTIPALYEDQEVLQAAPFIGELATVFRNAIARPSSQTAPQYSRASQAIFTAVYDILTNAKRPQDALDALEVDLQTVRTRE